MYFPCFQFPSPRFKKIIPIPEQSMVQMLCYLLECLLAEENTPPDCPKELYELYFVFAAVWAFGGSMFRDQVRQKMPLQHLSHSLFVWFCSGLVSSYFPKHSAISVMLFSWGCHIGDDKLETQQFLLRKASLSRV